MKKPNQRILKALEVLDLPELPPAEQEQMLLQIQDVVFKGSLVRIIEAMDDKAREEFTALTSRGASEDEVLDFVMDRVPHADALVEEKIAELADDILLATGRSA